MIYSFIIHACFLIFFWILWFYLAIHDMYGMFLQEIVKITQKEQEKIGDSWFSTFSAFSAFSIVRFGVICFYLPHHTWKEKILKRRVGNVHRRDDKQSLARTCLFSWFSQMVLLKCRKNQCSPPEHEKSCWSTAPLVASLVVLGKQLTTCPSQCQHGKVKFERNRDVCLEKHSLEGRSRNNCDVVNSIVLCSSLFLGNL